MRIIMFVGWGGIWPVPILKNLLANNDIEIVKIYSQGIHKEKIKNYSKFYSENYRDNVEAVIRKSRFKKYEVIKSANEKLVVDYLKRTGFDYIFTLGFGEIFKKEFINASSGKIINFHPGLLPENCGSDPNISSLISGNKGGVSLHYIDEGIDSGEVILKKEIMLSSDETYNSLQLKLSLFTCSLLPEFLATLKFGNIVAVKQNLSERTYYPKVSKSDKEVLFSMTAKQIKHMIRTFSGLYEKAFFVVNDVVVYAGNCESVTSVNNYVAGEFVDQGLDYIIFACSDGAVIFSDLRVNDYGPEQSLIELQRIYDE